MLYTMMSCNFILYDTKVNLRITKICLDTRNKEVNNR